MKIEVSGTLGIKGGLMGWLNQIVRVLSQAKLVKKVSLYTERWREIQVKQEKERKTRQMLVLQNLTFFWNKE
jgi:hypothetical protein